MLELANIRKVFNQGQHNEYWALEGIDLDIPPARVSVLKGPSGSGKTTLLTILGCLARPTEGRVRLNGEDISGLPERFLTEIRRRTFGFIFQQFNLIRGLSAIENIILPGYPGGTPRAQLLARAETLLADLQLAHRRDAKVEWLSGGEQQRVAICRALLNDPQILVADEPTANLDSKTLDRSYLATPRAASPRPGRTVESSPRHDPLVVESEVVDRVYSLRDGQLVEVVDTRRAWP